MKVPPSLQLGGRLETAAQPQNSIALTLTRDSQGGLDMRIWAYVSDSQCHHQP